MDGQANKTRRLTAAERIAISTGFLALAAGVGPIFGRVIVASTIGACVLGVTGVGFVAPVLLLVGESEDRHYRRRAL